MAELFHELIPACAHRTPSVELAHRFAEVTR